MFAPGEVVRIKQAVAVEKFYATLHPENIIPLPLTLGECCLAAYITEIKILHRTENSINYLAQTHDRWAT